MDSPTGFFLGHKVKLFQQEGKKLLTKMSETKHARKMNKRTDSVGWYRWKGAIVKPCNDTRLAILCPVSWLWLHLTSHIKRKGHIVVICYCKSTKSRHSAGRPSFPFSSLNNLSSGAVRDDMLHPYKTEKLENISDFLHMQASNLLLASNSSSGSHMWVFLYPSFFSPGTSAHNAQNNLT